MQQKLDELDKQVHVRIPADSAVVIGQRQEAGNLALDRETDNQGATDMQFGETAEFVLCRCGRRTRVVDFDDLEMTEPADQPRPVLQALAAEDLGRALCKTRFTDEHRLEVTAVLRNQRQKRGIATTGVAAAGLEFLEVDGNLGLQRVYGTAGAFSGTRSTVPGSRCGRGVGRVRHGWLHFDM